MRSSLVAAAVVVPAVLVSAISVASRTPRADRAWAEDVGVLASVETRPDGRVRLDGVRDWRYSADSAIAKGYFDETYDPAELSSLWFYEAPFGDSGLIAHTFLVFEFEGLPEDRRWLALSVEARKEEGEEYSILGGMMRSFEVTHVWATEGDVVTRRVTLYGDAVTRYRVTIPPEGLAPLFRELVSETRQLASTPRWYNTLSTNCTSLLARYANVVQADAVPWDPSFVLTGRAAAYLGELGYVEPGSGEAITAERLATRPLR